MESDLYFQLIRLVDVHSGRLGLVEDLPESPRYVRFVHKDWDATPLRFAALNWTEKKGDKKGRLLQLEFRNVSDAVWLCLVLGPCREDQRALKKRVFDKARAAFVTCDAALRPYTLLREEHFLSPWPYASAKELDEALSRRWDHFEKESLPAIKDFVATLFSPPKACL